MAGTANSDEKLQATFSAAISALEAQAEENALLEAERDALKIEVEKLRERLKSEDKRPVQAEAE